MTRYPIVLLLLVSLLAGCDATIQPPIPDPPNELAVYSTVRASDSTQYAVVTRARRADERTLQYVQDATVQINGHSLSVVPEDSIEDGGVNILTPPGDRRANYETDSLSVAPGETVQLRVARGENTVTGTVRVPGSFTGSVDSMTVRWRPSAGAKTYKVRVRRYEDDGGVAWEYVATTQDTAVTIPDFVDPGSSSYGGGAFEPGPHVLLITAVDSNLVKYQDNDTQRAGIEGGFGFFGAITRISGRVTLPATAEKTRKTTVPRLRPLGPQRGTQDEVGSGAHPPSP